MEIYDTANKLAEEIRNSKQFKNLKNLKEKIMADENKKKMITDFEDLKREIQFKEIQKQEVEESKKEELLKMYNQLINDKEIKEYFETEISFNQLMVDVNKIIGSFINTFGVLK